MHDDEREAVPAVWFPDLAGVGHARLVRQLAWCFRRGAGAGIAARFPTLLDRTMGPEDA
jgi:hypothetical protein